METARTERFVVLGIGLTGLVIAFLGFYFGLAPDPGWWTGGPDGVGTGFFAIPWLIEQLLAVWPWIVAAISAFVTLGSFLNDEQATNEKVVA